MKKLLVLSLAIASLISCTTSQRQPNSVNRKIANEDMYDSQKGLTDLVFNFDQDVPADDPYIIKDKDKSLDCRTELKFRNVEFQGQTFKRPIIDTPVKLRCPQVREMKTKRTWLVKKDHWSADDEKNFSSFVKSVGQTKCTTTDSCLAGSGNPYRTMEDMKNIFYADCADFPYYLRAYFAYKNNLPFTIVSKIAPRPLSAAQEANLEKRKQDAFNKGGQAELDKVVKQANDLRYTVNGNIPTGRYSVPSSTGEVRDFGQVALVINDASSTAMYRMTHGSDSIQSDFYSPKVTKSSIKPGTALYGVAGHAAIIYDIKSNGEPLMMDAHPDNSVSNRIMSMASSDFQLSKVDQGGNFKNFRDVKVVNAVKDSNGNITQGRVVTSEDNEHADYSLEQYDSDKFIVFGNKVRFFEWIRYQISGGTYRIKPTEELDENINGLCDAFVGRNTDIVTAMNNNVHKEAHISKLPNNIFGTTGLWEDFSTPSRDMRLRLKAREIMATVKEQYSRFKAGEKLISYSGSNLKQDLVKTFNNAASKCDFSYTKSDGSKKSVSFQNLLSRIPLISFDPYLCPELRWGATSEDELATCQDNAEKRKWHKYTQFLRNNLVKDTNAFHGYSLEQLVQMDASKKVNNSTNAVSYDILGVINAL